MALVAVKMVIMTLVLSARAAQQIVLLAPAKPHALGAATASLSRLTAHVRLPSVSTTTAQRQALQAVSTSDTQLIG